MKKHFSLNLIGFFGVLIAVGMIFLTILAATGSFHYRKTALSIRTGAATKMYDGKPLTSSQWYLISGEVAAEHELIVEPAGTQTEIGKSENVASIRVMDSSGLDVTDQYEIVHEFGELEVLRPKLTFSSESAEKIWDGNPLINKTVRLIDGRILDGASWEAYEFASPSNVGRYQNTYSITITDPDGVDITEKYDIERAYGELTIRQGYLLIESGSGTKEYDGKVFTNDECRIVEGAVAEGHTLQMRAIGSIQEVGFSRNTIQATITNEDGMDVTDLYDITLNTGLLTVTPRRLTIQTKDVTRPYYAQVIADDWALVGGSLLEGDELSVTTLQNDSNSIYSGEIGTFDNSVLYYEITNKNEQKNRSGCYQIAFLYGTLVLTE